jgi:hypothetical protein
LISFWDAAMVQHIKINTYNTAHKQNKGQKPHNNLNRCTEGLHDKNFVKLGIEGTYLIIIKATYNKPIANIDVIKATLNKSLANTVLNEEKMKSFSLNIWNKSVH